MKTHIDTKTKAVAIETLFVEWKTNLWSVERCAREYGDWTGYRPSVKQMYRYLSEYQEFLESGKMATMKNIKRCVPYFEDVKKNRQKFARPTDERADEIIEQIGWGEKPKKAKKPIKIVILWGLLEFQF